MQTINWHYSYYGCEYNKKPKYGVHYMVLDEYLLRSVDSARDKFKNDMKVFLNQFKKMIDKSVSSNKKAIKKLKAETATMSSLINAIAKENKLIVPKIKKSKMVKVEEEPTNDE